MNRDPDNDRAWMRRALRQARRGWGRTSPNPMVGAVIVRDGHLVAQGCHLRAGDAHAEVNALHKAGGAARGATLYVTLEPCSTAGRTGACTDAIRAAGIARVVVGSTDPNPAHNGQGIEQLRTDGIDVEIGILEPECRRINDAFFCWIQHGRPFVVLKLAMTLDGKIATASGESKWITGPQSRRRVQRLRCWADAVMVGAETVRRDDPELTVREPRGWARQPLRLVWTRADGVPPGTKLAAAQAGNPVRCVKADSPAAWRAFLRQLGKEEITSLLIEGGGELAGACLRAGVVDKVAFFVAPKLLGGRDSRPAVGGASPCSLTDAIAVRHMTTQRLGNDLLITGYISDVHRSY